MRLKRVRIFGFKTFADRTEFDLDGGIVAVVGPNGCGKSNLVDAILWGLGEGNSRQLRAQTSQDVIFSGSSRRKPIGLAEVSLLFDNEDGALPVDSAEVVITRRLTRAGDSEYSINRQSCRLRDVYDLLADSGLGRSGYSIVGQKEIDAALSASAEDRRAWIDEAAGVQRYRARKQESLRRLATAQDHLTRVTDILRELESQREPLREEAEVAAKYKALSTTLQSIELGMLVRDYQAAANDIAEAEARVSESTRLIAEASRRADAIDEEAKAIAQTVAELEAEIELDRMAQQQRISAIDRMESEIRLARQKLESFDQLESTLAADSEHAETRLADATAEVGRGEAELTEEQESLATLQTALAGAQSAAKEFSATLADLDAKIVAGRDEIARSMRADAEKKHRSERLKLAQRERSDIERTMPDLVDAVAEAEKALDEAEAPILALESEAAELNQDLAAIRREDDEDARTVRDSLAERSTLEGRKRGIEHTIEAYEGLSQGSRAVLEAVERGVISGEYRPVASVIETDRDLALAVETALGASANDLIVDDERAAKRAIEWLKANRAGRATFQPISLMRDQPHSADLERLRGDKGVVGIASRLVDCDAKYRSVIESLLGRVVIVETLDDGLRLAKTNGWSRMISIHGEVVHRSGAVTGGESGKQSYGFVQRRADLVEIEARLRALEKIVTEHDQRVRKRAQRSDQIHARINAINARLLEGRDEVEDARDYLNTLKSELKDAERSRDRLATEIERLSAPVEAESVTVDLNALQSERDQVLRELASHGADARQAEDRLREAESRVRAASQRLDHARRRLDLARASDDIRQRRIAELGPERASVSSEIENWTEQCERMVELRELAEVQLARKIETRRIAVDDREAKIEAAVAARRDASALGDAMHQAEISRTRAEARRSAVAARLIEEYNVGEEEARQTIVAQEIPDDAPSIVNRLRREMRAMGDVNLGAIEAFERVSRRYEELEAQRSDVLDGIEQVNASILELDKLTRDRFSTTFEAVAAAYVDIFQELFGGGEGRLRLSDPDNILESGVELDITLPGKRRQALNLLSGGERSLCATAFLFSLLHVKPSPLVVLDEVDAPLDGRNVERFAALLNRFVDRCQFIVITHNPTTIESAPIWLGVTMQEPGVSTLIPARLPGEKARVYVRSGVETRSTSDAPAEAMISSKSPVGEA